MQLRWSDGRSHAIQFEATDARSLAANAMTALEQFQRQAAKQYHDGATRRNMIHLPTAEFHIGLGGRWWNPGRIQSTSGLSYFETTPFHAHGATLENSDAALDERFEQQAFLLLVKSADLWERVAAAERWMGAIADIATTVADAVGSGDATPPVYPVWDIAPGDEYE